MSSVSIMEASDETTELSRRIENTDTYSSTKDPNISDQLQNKEEANSKTKWRTRAKKKIREKCFCTKVRWVAWFCSFFPFLHWIKEYHPRKDLLSDAVAGITVGIMSIPQGISYAGVAGVPAVYGLYSNFAPTTLYYFLGTSRLAAIGPPAVLCIMLGSSRHKHIPDSRSDLSPGCFPWVVSNLDENATALFWRGNATIHQHHKYTDKIDWRIFDNPDCFTSWQLVISMTMLAGMILVFMGILQLGFISNYLSDAMVGGFTSGAAVHVLASQLDYVFGTHTPWHTGVGKIIFTCADLAAHIADFVPATLAISLVCIATLLFIKEVLNPRFQKASGTPFPGELILIIIGTAASHFGRFDQTYHVETVHSISAGFPRPLLPRFDLMRRVALDALALAVVLYSLSISLGKLYAKRNGYKIDANQEFFAYGMINIAGAIFQCFAAGQVVSRSIVYESSGARSQFAGVFGAAIVMVTILWIAPLLASLPKCILGSIILVSCIQMLKQLKQLKPLYLVSKCDFCTYLFTFLAVLLLNVVEGLAASVVFAASMALFRSQWSKLKYLCSSQTQNDNDAATPKVIVFRFDEPLDYNGAPRFSRLLYETCNLDPDQLLAERQDIELGPISAPAKSEIALIIDCSSFHYIDSMGVRALTQADEQLVKRSIAVYYVECEGDNLETLTLSRFFTVNRATRRFETIRKALAAMASTRLVPLGAELETKDKS